MKRVLAVCGAGASSTFLVYRMRSIVRDRGLDLVVDAGTLDDLLPILVDTDLVLVAHHLHDHFTEIDHAATAAGTRAVLLPPVGVDAAGAIIAVDTAIATLQSPPSPPSTPQHIGAQS